MRPTHKKSRPTHKKSKLTFSPSLPKDSLCPDLQQLWWPRTT